jgi:hypothetical protein
LTVQIIPARRFTVQGIIGAWLVSYVKTLGVFRQALVEDTGVGFLIGYLKTVRVRTRHEVDEVVLKDGRKGLKTALITGVVTIALALTNPELRGI